MAKKTLAGPNQLLLDFDAIMEDVLFKLGCTTSLKNDLSTLYESQIEDVSRIEKRFEVGKGYMITNGTGFGKTFIGLGTIKRFVLQEKHDILIVVPTDAKCKDWIDDGIKVGVPICQLQGANDAGFMVTVTTYANFYQNKAILQRSFDLIVYDESHYLMQNGQGKNTVYLEQHRKICVLPSAAKQMAWEIVGEMPDYNNREALKKWKEDMLEEAMKLTEKTKVLFLSATPFAYHKNLKYADGILWDIEETFEEVEYDGAYNAANGFDKFLVEHFGYRMRNGRCCIPESGVDIDLLERNFFEKQVERGVMSTRRLELDYDYSRQFITVDSGLGEKIDQGMSLMYDKYFRKKYKIIALFADRKYNGHYVNKLLECVKAKEIVLRIKQHSRLGRKVVIFHGYNDADMAHPFRFGKEMLPADFKHYAQQLEKENREFALEYPQYAGLDLSDLKDVRTTIQDAFPTESVQFNGRVSKKKRFDYVKEFQEDNSYTNIIVVQTKAGREGISLHDTTGEKQRVLINVGLPTSPTQAIQEEGRVYRSGLRSDSIYEYITLQTATERIAFGTTIATRAKTAENLAMGNKARDLESAFKNGYTESDYFMPNLNQGKGGKEKDRRTETISEWDKAKTYYYQRGKKTQATKAKEGKDYFATPEPLGYKIVQWLNPQPNEDGLEPSAGHGAIARWFPKTTNNKFVEPSLHLASELSVNSTGEVYVKPFEEHSIQNKYDFIAMNPPFGSNSKTAMEHLAKAVVHIKYRANGRIIAILPNGPSMNKRLDEFFISEKFENYEFTGQILLPNITFERAGTKVGCQVIKIERKDYDNHRWVKHDLTHCQTVEQFFDELEHLEF